MVEFLEIYLREQEVDLLLECISEMTKVTSSPKKLEQLKDLYTLLNEEETTYE